MQTELATSQNPNQLKDILVKTLKDHIFSKADLSDDQKAEQSYNLLVASLSKFLVNTKLQFRVLLETRALEQALGKMSDKFDITLVAKPKNVQAEQIAQEFNEATAVDAQIVETKEESKETSSETAISNEQPSTVS